MKLCLASCLSLNLTYDGDSFIIRKLEIIPMDNNYCFSTTLFWISNGFLISATCSICKIKPVVYPKVIGSQFSVITESKWILLPPMLNSKSGHWRESVFFLFIGFGLKFLNPIPPLHFCLKNLIDFKKKPTYGRLFHGFPTRATWNHIHWKLHYIQIVELVTKHVSQH